MRNVLALLNISLELNLGYVDIHGFWFKNFTSIYDVAQSAGAVEFTDCTSALTSVPDMTCPEDLPRAMNDREEWRERVRDIGVTSAI